MAMSRPTESSLVNSRCVALTRTSAALDIDSIAPYILSAAKTTKRKGHVDAPTLAGRWRIGQETARRTLERTTQLGVRDLTNSTMTRRLKPYTLQLRYPRLNVTMYADILIGRCRSLRNNMYATVFATDFQWSMVDPIQTKGECHLSLDVLHATKGIPSIMVPDNAKELTQGDFRRKCRSAGTRILPIEPYTPNQNAAESTIRELLREYRRDMRETNTPECLWDVCLEYRSHIRRHSALNIKGLKGDVPETLLTGDTPDISYLCEFGWYDWVWHMGPEDDSKQRVHLGRYCGPSHDVGEAMTCLILVETGEFLSRTSVYPLSDEDKASDAIKEKKTKFTADLEASIVRKGRKPSPPDSIPDSVNPKYLEGDPEEPEPYQPVLGDDPSPTPLADDMSDTEWKTFDKYLHAKVRIPRGEDLAYGKVVGRKRDRNNCLIGHSDPNPLLNTAVYEVQFDDGLVEEYTGNLVAEAMYAHVDDEGYTLHLVDEIIDHCKDDTAVPIEDAFYVANGNQRRKQTTRGWQLCIRWKDGTTTWMDLKDLKDAEPILVAEYAKTNKLMQEPAFAWWAPIVLRRKERLVKAMKKRYFKRNQKYGIELPKDTYRAYKIDEETGTTFWKDAIEKEMKNVMVAFEILEDDEVMPVGYSEITGHLVFDVKADFTRKARYVAGGHLTEPPASITYASVVSRESVRIAFTIAALNGLDVMTADAQNAYLNSKPKEHYWIR